MKKNCTNNIAPDKVLVQSQRPPDLVISLSYSSSAPKRGTDFPGANANAKTLRLPAAGSPRAGDTRPPRGQ